MKEKLDRIKKAEEKSSSRISTERKKLADEYRQAKAQFEEDKKGVDIRAARIVENAITEATKRAEIKAEKTHEEYRDKIDLMKKQVEAREKKAIELIITSFEPWQ